jgi:cell division septal protein FtsQ
VCERESVFKMLRRKVSMKRKRGKRNLRRNPKKMILMLVIIKVFTLFIIYFLFIWNGLLIGNWLNNV